MLPCPSSPITTSASLVQRVPMAKRQRYLSELLTSERVYASDLALIREIHVPMALNQRVSLNVTSPSPSTSRISISSHSSSSSLNPPMTPEDARIIFRNIAELARFADSFCDCLEEALGSTFEGGQGEDHVGGLFLENIPEMERVFTHYIIRHSAALAHLQALPQTPALATYLQHVQAMGSIYSHTRDLPSFLTKPVHRLLMYSSLLASITDETPDMHSDKESLKLARAKMEEVVRNLNERRRGWEVVKEALSAKEVVKVGFTPSVSLTTMKLLWRRSDARSAQPGIMDANGEAAQVERMRAELKRVDIFTQQFSEGVVRWVKMTSNVVLALKAWSVNFGKVLGLSEEQGSETFSAFLAVIEALVPLCHQLTIDVNDQLIMEIASLRASMDQPLKVLSFMTEQAPFHHKFATDTSMKHPRFPTPLTSASYVALRRQLAAELPTYLTLLHRGLTVTVRRLAKIQATFWGSMHVSLAELWDMMRMEGEINKGHSETVAVWERRWSEVNEVMCTLSIMQTDSVYQERLRPSIATTNGKAFAGHAANLTTQPSPPAQRQHQESGRPTSPSSPSPPQQQPTYMNLDKDSWMARRAKYVCQVVHAWKQPMTISYFNFPFFTLVEGENFDVLHEAGHPSTHPNLPLPVDDGENCLLLCRDGAGEVGWALASFLAPS